MSTSLCPAAVNTDNPPVGCTMFDHDCVDDPDLECEWFIGYLHNVLFGDKTIHNQQSEGSKWRAQLREDEHEARLRQNPLAGEGYAKKK